MTTVPPDEEFSSLSSLNERNSYNIKKVIDCRIDAFNIYYKVKWQSSWLPAHYLVDCEYLVHQYWATCDKGGITQQCIETTPSLWTHSKLDCNTLSNGKSPQTEAPLQSSKDISLSSQEPCSTYIDKEVGTQEHNYCIHPGLFQGSVVSSPSNVKNAVTTSDISRKVEVAQQNVPHVFTISEEQNPEQKVDPERIVGIGDNMETDTALVQSRVKSFQLDHFSFESPKEINHCDQQPTHVNNTCGVEGSEQPRPPCASPYEAQVSPNEVQVSANEAQLSSNEAQGSPNEAQGSSNEVQGSPNEVQGIPNDSQVSSNEVQVTKESTNKFSIYEDTQQQPVEGSGKVGIDGKTRIVSGTFTASLMPRAVNEISDILVKPAVNKEKFIIGKQRPLRRRNRNNTFSDNFPQKKSTSPIESANLLPSMESVLNTASTHTVLMQHSLNTQNKTDGAKEDQRSVKRKGDKLGMTLQEIIDDEMPLSQWMQTVVRENNMAIHEKDDRKNKDNMIDFKLVDASLSDSEDFAESGDENGKEFGQNICHECKKVFQTKGSLNHHLKLHSGVKPFTCSECNRTFTYKHHLKYHMLSHSGKTLFACISCAFKTNCKSYFKKHVCSIRQMKRCRVKRPSMSLKH